MKRCLSHPASDCRPHFLRTFGPLLAVIALILGDTLTARARAQQRRPVDEVPIARIFGRIVDSKGVGVPGAEVEVHTVGEPWRSGEARESFEVSSTPSGTFELSVPTPTSDWISLFIRPSRYLDIDSRDFGPAGGRDQPRLKSGDNDLGTFELGPTGALAGRIVDDRGQPVAGAEVRLHDSFPGGLGRQGTSNERGEYEVAHVPAGNYVLEVLADGHELAKRVASVVVAEQTTSGIHFALTRALTISGVVVDEAGVGVANARVWGWPVGSGTGSGARTDAQGRFVVALKQSEPHVFDVEAEGFAKLESMFEGLEDLEQLLDNFDESSSGALPFARSGKHHAPGATDVRLVLKRPVLTRFVVLDAATSAPVTHYAVRLEWKQIGLTTRSGGEPEYLRGEHQNGEFECEADPNRHTYVIEAPGYGPARGAIEHDSPQTRRCVVRLVKGGALVGRVNVEGQAVEGAKVILRETTLEELNEGPIEDEDDFYWNDWDGSTDPFLFDENRRSMHSDVSGAFHFDSLEAGDYRLEVTTVLGERRALEPIRITPGAPTDLGAVELLLAAELEGRVVTPASTSPAGLTIRATTFDQTRTATSDADGHFRIHALPAGRVHVQLQSKPGVVTWSPTQHFELAPDQTKNIVLDAREYAGASFALVARIDGQPAPKLSVSLQTSADEKRSTRLNDTDKDGATSGWISAIGEADLHLRAPSGMAVATRPKAALLAPGADVKLELDLACGQLTFEWPALPPGEKLRQVAFDGRRQQKRVSYAVWFVRPIGRDADIVRRSEQRCEFRWVEPGDYEWTVRVNSSSATEESIDRFYRRSSTVVAGALVDCVVRDEHRIPPPPNER